METTVHLWYSFLKWCDALQKVPHDLRSGTGLNLRYFRELQELAAASSTLFSSLHLQVKQQHHDNISIIL